MLKLVAQGEQEIKKGALVEQEEFFKAMDKRFD